MVAQGLYFADAKDFGEIRTSHLIGSRRMQVGWVKIGHFR